MYPCCYLHICILAILEPIPKGEAAVDYLNRCINPTLLKGLTELCKTKPDDPFVSTNVNIVSNKLVILLKMIFSLVFSLLLTSLICSLVVICFSLDMAG